MANMRKDLAKIQGQLQGVEKRVEEQAKLLEEFRKASNYVDFQLACRKLQKFNEDLLKDSSSPGSIAECQGAIDIFHANHAKKSGYAECKPLLEDVSAALAAFKNNCEEIQAILGGRISESNFAAAKGQIIAAIDVQVKAVEASRKKITGRFTMIGRILPSASTISRASSPATPSTSSMSPVPPDASTLSPSTSSVTSPASTRSVSPTSPGEPEVGSVALTVLGAYQQQHSINKAAMAELSNMMHQLGDRGLPQVAVELGEVRRKLDVCWAGVKKLKSDLEGVTAVSVDERALKFEIEVYNQGYNRSCEGFDKNLHAMQAYLIPHAEYLNAVKHFTTLDQVDGVSRAFEKCVSLLREIEKMPNYARVIYLAWEKEVQDANNRFEAQKAKLRPPPSLAPKGPPPSAITASTTVTTPSASATVGGHGIDFRSENARQKIGQIDEVRRKNWNYQKDVTERTDTISSDMKIEEGGKELKHIDIYSGSVRTAEACNETTGSAIGKIIAAGLSAHDSKAQQGAMILLFGEPEVIEAMAKPLIAQWIKVGVLMNSMDPSSSQTLDEWRASLTTSASGISPRSR